MPFRDTWKAAEVDMKERKAAQSEHSTIDADTTSLPPSYIPCASTQEAQPAEIALYKDALERHVRERKLQQWYSDDKVLTDLAKNGPRITGTIMEIYKVPFIVALDFFMLILYDLVLMLDDSSSMRTGGRIDEMKAIAGVYAVIGTVCDSDGVQVRAMNADLGRIKDASGRQDLQDHATDEESVNKLVNSIKSWEGQTPMGGSMYTKVIFPLVKHKIQTNRFSKPVLLHVLGDGEPFGEEEDLTRRNLQALYDHLDEQKISRGAFSVMFGLVVHEPAAVEFLHRLDDDKNIGAQIDVVEDSDTWLAKLKKKEEEKLKEKDKVTEWNSIHWIAKFMLGALMKKYDDAD
ncbi:hypothetical protein F5Y18DRAFT_94935 [Xylariaceae sp. FL1019]|nr:hypothetical protein F5Y18DRAFT_94935 [Xylariaceae sp. FL1019]